MIRMKEVPKDLTFDDAKFDCNEEWVRELGAYGDSSGFNEIATLPHADKARLIANPISDHKDCNTRCEYCLSRYFSETYSHFRPSPIEELVKNIPIHKPSILEMTSGELLQKRNEKELEYFFKFMDEVDPQKKIKIEITTNGIDVETIKKYYSNGRITLQLSLEPCVRSNNPRLTRGERMMNTIVELAKISPRNMQVAWMLRPDYDRTDFKWFVETIKSLNTTFSIQPVNQITGFYEVDTSFDLDFMKAVQEDYPDFHKWYPYTNLVFPKLTCFEGNIILNGFGQIIPCAFCNVPVDSPHAYGEYLNCLKPVKVSAGVCHVCSYLTAKGIPKNYLDLERMAYTTMGINLLKKHGENALQAAEAIKDLYRAQIQFKRDALSEVGEDRPNVATDLVYAHDGGMSKMAILRLLENVGIAVKSVNGQHVNDDMWFSHTDGEDVTCYDIDYFMGNYVDPDSVVAVYTLNNFPAQIWTMGRAKDVKSAINSTNKRVYPKEMAALPCLSKKISHFIRYQS